MMMIEDDQDVSEAKLVDWAALDLEIDSSDDCGDKHKILRCKVLEGIVETGSSEEVS